MAQWHSIPVQALESGRAVVDIDGREVALFLVDGRVHAFENACPHEGNPLVEGEVLGSVLACAFHGWRFDLETGACLAGDHAAKRYPAELQDEAIWIAVED
ncbi:MAG: Rieske (2Fe-2S) protein [Actinomycetota bacterium]|nr:Rieske (2Fe-2S) protein [Actinomycetota bacterium]